MLYEMRLVGLAMDPFSNSPIVILKDRESVEAEQDAENAADTDESGEEELLAAVAEAAAEADIEEEDTADDASFRAALDEEEEARLQELEDAAPFVSNQPPRQLDDAAPGESNSEERILPIWIGESEAHAIATVLLGLSPPRPMTHDLLFETIQALGGSIHRVIVTDLRDNTFYASIELIHESGELMTLDARPSDAIALALRCDADIFVEGRVLEKTKQSDDTPQLDEDDLEELDHDQWKELVESLNSDSAKKYTQ